MSSYKDKANIFFCKFTGSHNKTYKVYTVKVLVFKVAYFLSSSREYGLETKSDRQTDRKTDEGQNSKSFTRAWLNYNTLLTE